MLDFRTWLLAEELSRPETGRYRCRHCSHKGLKDWRELLCKRCRNGRIFLALEDADGWTCSIYAFRTEEQAVLFAEECTLVSAGAKLTQGRRLKIDGMDRSPLG